MSESVRTIAIRTARRGKTEDLEGLLFWMAPYCRAEPGNTRWDVWPRRCRRRPHGHGARASRVSVMCKLGPHGSKRLETAYSLFATPPIPGLAEGENSPTNSYGETLAGSILCRPLPSNSLLIFGSSI